MIDDAKLDELLALADKPMFYAGSGDRFPMQMEHETIRELVQEIKDRRYIEKHPTMRLDTYE